MTSGIMNRLKRWISTKGYHRSDFLYEVLTSKTVPADQIDGVMTLENTAQENNRRSQFEENCNYAGEVSRV